MEPAKENEAFLNAHYHSPKQTNNSGAAMKKSFSQLNRAVAMRKIIDLVWRALPFLDVTINT